MLGNTPSRAVVSIGWKTIAESHQPRFTGSLTGASFTPQPSIWERGELVSHPGGKAQFSDGSSANGTPPPTDRLFPSRGSAPVAVECVTSPDATLLPQYDNPPSSTNKATHQSIQHHRASEKPGRVRPVSVKANPACKGQFAIGKG